MSENQMTTNTEEVKVDCQTFDHTVIHSDDFYSSYVKNFEQCKKKKLLYKFFKRFFDIIVSFLCLIVFSPIMLIIAIAIKCDSKGPVIFKQPRMGKNNKPFMCYKFRSMRIDAPKNMATSLLTG